MIFMPAKIIELCIYSSIFFFQVMKYEAVYPISGLIDMKRRLGPNRRCFVFMHEAMDREPLVVVYVAFTKKIAKNLEVGWIFC